LKKGGGGKIGKYEFGQGLNFCRLNFKKPKTFSNQFERVMPISAFKLLDPPHTGSLTGHLFYFHFTHKRHMMFNIADNMNSMEQFLYLDSSV
jgi:hypothetical protein